MLKSEINKWMIRWKRQMCQLAKVWQSYIKNQNKCKVSRTLYLFTQYSVTRILKLGIAQINCSPLTLPIYLKYILLFYKLKNHSLIKVFCSENVLKCYFFFPSACGGVQSGERGVISSPNYPEPYSNLNHCSWVLEAPEGETITVSNRSRSCAQQTV